MNEPMSTEMIIEKLSNYAEEYKDNEDIKLSELSDVCKSAVETIKTLQASRHTQKRARNRLSKSNKKLRKQIEKLTAQLEEGKTNEN